MAKLATPLLSGRLDYENWPYVILSYSSDNPDASTGQDWLYTIYRKLSSETSWSFLSLRNADTNSFNDISATAGNTYDYAIMCIARDTSLYSNSDLSESVTVVVPSTQPAIPIETPTILVSRGNMVGPNVVISMSCATTANSGWSYEISRKLSSSSSWSVLGTTSSSYPMYTDTTTSPGTSYDYRVRGVSSSGTYTTSSYSAVGSITTAGTITLQTPVVSGYYSANSVKLNWSTINFVSSYTLQKKASTSSTWSTISSSLTTTSYTDSAVTLENTYDYRVKANGDGRIYSDSSYCLPASVLVTNSPVDVSKLLNISIDGVSYKIGIEHLSLKRTMKVFEGPNSGTSVTGREIRDILGVNYRYSIKVRSIDSLQSNYDSFFEAITDRSGYHSFVLPFGQTTISFNAKVESASDTFYGYEEDTYIWDEIEAEFNPVSSVWSLATTPPSISSFNDPSLGLTVDSFTYAVGIEFGSIKRSFEMKQGPFGKTSIRGTELADILGNTYSYTMKVHSLDGHQDHYDALFNLLSNDSSYHTIRIRFGQEVISFDAKIEDVTDVFVGKENGIKIWDDMDVTFTPIDISYSFV